MRYTFEFFEEVLGPDAKPLIATTKDMQDHLGDLQDAVVTCTILRNFLTWGSWEPPAGQRAARHDHDRRARRGRLPRRPPGGAQPPGRHLPSRCGSQIRGNGFSRRLAKVVGEL